MISDRVIKAKSAFRRICNYDGTHFLSFADNISLIKKVYYFFNLP